MESPIVLIDICLSNPISLVKITKIYLGRLGFIWFTTAEFLSDLEDHRKLGKPIENK